MAAPFDWLFGSSDTSQQQPSAPAPLLYSQPDPNTGVAPSRQRWIDALSALGATMRDAGAFVAHQPEAANNLSGLTQMLQQRRAQQQLAAFRQGALGTPQLNTNQIPITPNPIMHTSAELAALGPDAQNATAQQFSDAQSALNARAAQPDTIYSGGALPSDQASLLAPVISKLPPDIGAKMLLDQVVTQMSPKDGFTLGPGQNRYTAGGTQIASAPQLPSYGDKGTGINPATGKQDTYIVDSKTGQQKWLGIVPPQTTALTAADYATLGINPASLPPGTFLQRTPDGAITVAKAGDMRSPGAQQQDIAIAQAKELAGNPALPALNRIASGQPLSDSDKAILAVEKPNATTDDAAVQHTAQAIANYQLAPLSGFSMRSPYGQAVMAKVTELNPNYNAQNFSKSQAAYRAFGTGQQGNTVRSLNVAMSHLGTLGDLGNQLNNGNVPVLNSAGNYIWQNVGGSPVTNFNAAKQIIGDEVTKAIVGTGGSNADREKAQATINAASSPAQLQGVIGTYKKLFTGQLQGLQRQYEQSTMRHDFPDMLSPDVAPLLSGQSAAPSTQGWTVQKVQ